MTNKLNELVENQQIGEPEIVDLIHSYYKLVNHGVFSQEEFNIVLNRLGIVQEGDKFTFDVEDMSYILN